MKLEDILGFARDFRGGSTLHRVQHHGLFLHPHRPSHICHTVGLGGLQAMKDAKSNKRIFIDQNLAALKAR